MNQKEDLDELYFKALKIEEDGNEVEAFRLFMQGAALGDDGAINAVGLAYDSGAGVEKDKGKAIAWYKKAWRTGKQVGYCENVALTYAEIGRHRRALYWWRKAVAIGSGGAALSLAKFLLKSKRREGFTQALDLLRMALTCEESWQICLDEKEEAQQLLDKLTAENLFK
jgi:TPR repeat protein